jgi:hypothetical protein
VRWRARTAVRAEAAPPLDDDIERRIDEELARFEA